MDKFKKKIQEQAKGRQSEAGKEFGNGKNSSSLNGEKQKTFKPIKNWQKWLALELEPLQDMIPL